jgi:hypothetical protein
VIDLGIKVDKFNVIYQKVMISWIPVSAPIKEKLSYSLHKSKVKDLLQGIQHEFVADCKDEVM